MRYDVLFLPLLFPEPFRSSSYTPPTYLSQAQIFISEGSSGAPNFLSNCAFCVCASTMSSVALGRPSTALPRVLLKRPGARTRTFFASAPWGKQRLVILGSGWGGYEVLRAVDKKRWSKFFPTCDILVWLATGRCCISQPSCTRLDVPWRLSYNQY